MFEIKNISKKYKNEYAVKNLILDIGSGLNFIIGSSGSGKTTLLKIISGLDNEFEGEVLYLGQNIKNLTDDQKAYYYNNKFGFVWQDFNLIENMTVEENILLSLHIKNANSSNEFEKVLRKLKITNLRNKKVKELSGGQKQRVAIGRELAKNPEVIIADEPTSALDSKTSLEVMELLKEISKDRTVIIVTHDTSLIDENSKVYELDKGELVSKPKAICESSKVNKINSSIKFKLKKALKVGRINNKSQISRSIVTCLSIIVSSVLLMTSLSGVISNSGEKSFEKLFEQYGKSILDISVIKSFTSAKGMKGVDEEEPKADVNQDINGLYDKYINDNRVEYLLLNRTFDNINIGIDGAKYSINNSGTAPAIKEIILGNTPKNKGEVLVPQSFVKSMGISNEDVIGKEIDFKAGIYNWDSGQPELKNINIKAKIVGVSDSTLKSDFEGKSYEFELEDSFFFDKETLDEVNKQAGVSNNHDFVIRAKDPKSLIEIKNEISAKGIVPIGEFELVEDIVKLNSQTSNLSKSSTIIISTLSIIGVMSISLITSFIRRSEYAIYKVCGYSKSQLSLVLFAESIILSVISAVLVVALSPVISMLTEIIFGASIANIKTLSVGIIISLILSFILYMISNTVAKNTNPLIVLKSGER
ncbi:ABC transporter ATP-binding protein/permease [Terrisporobacter petrolearius]|uniref:ABC transporter ATP-binding protein/permease n=1 Tax=Terrisporobacter petrolearius TaxID=1460447 RepID=UPI0031CCA7F7